MENRRCTDAARATLLGVFTMLGAGATRAQVTADWDIHPPPTLAPSLFGQWEGPYDLGPLMVTGGHVAEIGHAVYLADGEFAGQVMFWNVPDDDLNIYAPRSFIWDPDARDPINVTAKAIPALLDATEEPFCGGHVPLSNGDILSLGGLNFSEFQMLGSVRGVRAMFLFSLASQTWQRVWNGASIVELNQEWTTRPRCVPSTATSSWSVTSTRSLLPAKDPRSRESGSCPIRCPWTSLIRTRRSPP